MNVRYWFDTRQAAEHTGHHPDTVRRALEAGELHGTQRTVRGRWRIHVDCLDAWVLNQPCTHQRPQPRPRSLRTA